MSESTDTRRLFPVTAPMTSKQAAKSGPSPARIPWSVAEKAYSVYVGRYGCGQSLTRIAERGGFYAEELDDLFPGWRDEASEITALRAELETTRQERDTWKEMHANTHPPSAEVALRDRAAEAEQRAEAAESRLRVLEAALRTLEQEMRTYRVPSIGTVSAEAITWADQIAALFLATPAPPAVTPIGPIANDGPPCVTCGHPRAAHNADTGLGECYAEREKLIGGICQCEQYKADPLRPRRGHRP